MSVHLILLTSSSSPFLLYICIRLYVGPYPSNYSIKFRENITIGSSASTRFHSTCPSASFQEEQSVKPNMYIDLFYGLPFVRYVGRTRLHLFLSLCPIVDRVDDRRVFKKRRQPEQNRASSPFVGRRKTHCNDLRVGSRTSTCSNEHVRTRCDFERACISFLRVPNQKKKQKKGFLLRQTRNETLFRALYVRIDRKKKGIEREREIKKESTTV